MVHFIWSFFNRGRSIKKYETVMSSKLQHVAVPGADHTGLHNMVSPDEDSKTAFPALKSVLHRIKCPYPVFWWIDLRNRFVQNPRLCFSGHRIVHRGFEK